MASQDLPQRDLGKTRNTQWLEISRRRVRRNVARCRAFRLQPDACVFMESPAAVERLCSARRFDEWPVDLRSVRISIVLFCEHACVSHCLLLLSTGKQDGVQTTRQCGRVCDATFIAASVAERGLRVAAVNRDRLAALHAPPDKRSAVRPLEAQSTVVGMRVAKGRALLKAFLSVLQKRFLTVCPCALL